jgi:hypothetical protein
MNLKIKIFDVERTLVSPLSVELDDVGGHARDRPAADPNRDLSPAPPTPTATCDRRCGPQPRPVTDAADPNRDLSPTPATPLGDVAGVADRWAILSMA